MTENEEYCEKAYGAAAGGGHAAGAGRLLKLGVIAGEDSDYGLYVKTVNGETADYDKDGAYWAFYVNGEYAMSGVDYTAPEAGTTYGFHVEKAEG